MNKLAVITLLCVVLCLCFAAGAWATNYGQHYGVVDQWQGEGGNNVMDIIMRDLGAKWIRSGWDWDLIEGPGDDQYDPGYLKLMDDWVEAMDAIGVNIFHGFSYTPAWLRPAGTTNSTPPSNPAKYPEYITFMVNRYKGSIKHWGLWNEPNLSHFYSGTLDSYIQNLMLPGIDAIKAADPTAKVVVGELSTSGDDVGKLRTMLRAITAAGKKDKVDVICHHSYDGGDTASGRLADMDNLRNMIVAEGYGDKDFWCTETSWESDDEGEAGQANQIIAFMQGMDARPWWKKTFYFTLTEGPGAHQGLLRTDHSPKPAYTQYQTYIADHADDAEIVSDTIPATMVAGRQYYVSVTVKNTGTATWQESEEHKLGAVNDSDPFAGGRCNLNSGESVPPDAVKSFWFTMTAPGTTGTYTTDWRMVHEGVHWFGHPLVKQVSVTNGPDTTPPGQVTNLAAAPGDYQVSLSWQNPTDADFTNTMIRYKTTAYPTNITDGTLLIDRTSNPGTSDTFNHTSLTNGTTYYYSVFTRDSVFNYAAKKDISAVPADVVPPDAVTGFTVTTTTNRNALSWTNPTAPDFAGTMIRYRTDIFPTSPTDGTLLCTRTASPSSSDSYVHDGINNGTTYYYAAFTYDEIPNYSAASTGSGRPLGPRETFSSSKFNTDTDGWSTYVWKAGSFADGMMAWNAAAGRSGGGMRCNGSGNTDDNQSCVREGGEIRKIISTTGYEKIQFIYDIRVNNLGNNVTGPGDGICGLDHNLLDEQLTIFYSTNGGANWTEVGYTIRPTLLFYQSYGTFVVDLSGISACNDNPNFMLRFRWQLNTTSDAADIDNISVTGNALGSPDITAPGAASNFVATRGDKQVSLSWRNPSDYDLTGTMIRCSTSGYPASITDGTLVCNKNKTPDSTDSFTHTGLTNGVTYYYSAFAYDEAPNYASAVNANAIPADATAPSNASGFNAIQGNTQNTLTWNNPSTSDFTGAMIRYKTTGYPTGPTDGILVVDKPNTPSSVDNFTHTGLTNGVTYYYKAYAHDIVPNYASGVSANAIPIYFDPAQAKMLANNTPLTLTAGIVSARFTDFLYVQCEDKPIAIRVNKSAHGLNEGEHVGVKGTVLTDPISSEKYISALWAKSNGIGVVDPIAMSNAAIGGVNWNYSDSTGAGQRGIAGGLGPNNMGVLVRIWGRVTSRDTANSAYFYIDDGSYIADGTLTGSENNIGVRVSANPTSYARDSFVIVTGVVSCFKDTNGNVRRMILPKQDGIQPIGL